MWPWSVRQRTDRVGLQQVRASASRQPGQVRLAKHHRLTRASGDAALHGRMQLGAVLVVGRQRVVTAHARLVEVVQRLPADAGTHERLIDRHPEPDRAGSFMEEGIL